MIPERQGSSPRCGPAALKSGEPSREGLTLWFKASDFFEWTNNGFAPRPKAG
jgi:hypothetical protein